MYPNNYYTPANRIQQKLDKIELLLYRSGAKPESEEFKELLSICKDLIETLDKKEDSLSSEYHRSSRLSEEKSELSKRVKELEPLETQVKKEKATVKSMVELLGIKFQVVKFGEPTFYYNETIKDCLSPSQVLEEMLKKGILVYVDKEKKTRAKENKPESSS